MSEQAGTSSLDQAIRQYLDNHRGKVVVLDDDPTGVQTVHDIRVITAWDEELLKEAVLSQDTMFYILTNTRSMNETKVKSILEEIARRLTRVSEETGIPISIISRGDSTLRGHFPLETDVLASVLFPNGEPDGTFLIPAFFEGGRITSNNTQYLLENDKAVPVHETEFARDPVFGYRCSDLTKYIEEKTRGRIRAEDVLCLTLEDLRIGGPDFIYERIMGMRSGQAAVVNAENYDDLKRFTLGLLRAEAEGRRFLFRTAASFAKVRGGIPDQPLLTHKQLIRRESASKGGLVIVGSYVHKTTAQLQHLLRSGLPLTEVELSVPQLLNAELRKQEIDTALTRIRAALERGGHAVVYTSRELVKSIGDAENLSIGQTVSSAVIEVVRRLEAKPKFMIAKGGITSSDIATLGLGIRSALILGQAAKGIPVWKCGPEAKYPGMPYIVFPGNVGSVETLTEVVRKCSEIEEG